MAQSVGGLTLLTIARGFDDDFSDLHPLRLRRFRLGPMYSHSFTSQTGPIRQILEQARAPQGEDWALVWTEEDLRSERVERSRPAGSGATERQVFALSDPKEQGVTELSRASSSPPPLPGLGRARPPPPSA
jgi:hypothetical protein